MTINNKGKTSITLEPSTFQEVLKHKLNISSQQGKNLTWDEYLLGLIQKVKP